MSALDDAVGPAVADLTARKVPRPDAVLFFATGVGMMPSRLKNSGNRS